MHFPSPIYECEPLIHKQIGKLVTVLQDHVGNPTDMLNWFRLTAFDVVGMLPEARSPFTF